MPKTRSKQEINSKRLGALAGALAGDALGWPVAGLSPDEIEVEWGIVSEMSDGDKGGRGSGGDYTQLAMLTLRSMAARGCFDGDDTARRLVDWMSIAKSRVHATYRAAARLKQGMTRTESALEFPTSGAACRDLPRMVLSPDLPPEDRSGDLEESAYITHKHASSIAASHVLDAALNGMISGELDPGNTADFVSALGAAARPHDEEMAGTLENLTSLLDLEVTEGLRYISTTADVTEALPAACFCFLHSPDDFERSVIAAVNAGFATDAMGFMVGALSGCHVGLDAIPLRWREATVELPGALELAELILGK